MPYKLSLKQQKAEILRCGRDPEYFITNYVYISHPVKGSIPFNLYEYQKDVLRDLQDHKFNIILKSRQLGMSTLAAAHIIHMCLFKKEQKIVVVSQRQIDAADVLKKIKSAYKNLPQWLKITKPVGGRSDSKIGSTRKVEFSNGSTVVAESTSGNAARGGAASLLVIDEAAAIDNKQITEMWSSAYPTLSTGGKCLIISTPRGVGNFYYDTWQEAIQGENDFNPIKLHWSMHPDYDQAWYEKQCRNMPPQQVAQEYDCSFNKSGETVFDPSDIERYEKFIDNYTSRPVFWADWCEEIGAIDADGNRTLRQLPEKTYIDRNFNVWERYRAGKNYVIGADVSRGDGKDFSTAVVLKVETGEIVAEYRGKLHPSDFALLLEEKGHEYGEAMLAVENNNHGLTVLSDLEKLEYPNIYYSYKSTHEYCNPVDAMYEQGVVPGLTTGPVSKHMYLAKLQDYIRKSKLTIYSNRITDEMNTFIFHENNASSKSVKVGAMQNKNDDLISAMMMAVWAREAAFDNSKRDAEYSKAFLKAIVKSTNELDTRINGMMGYGNKMKKAAEARKKKKAYANRKKMYWPSVIKG
jgi:hypothetical protein